MVPDVQVHAAGQRGGGAPPHQRRIQVLYCDCTVHCTVLYCDCTVLYYIQDHPHRGQQQAELLPHQLPPLR